MKSGNEVERYYESNTQRFLKFGGGRQAHAIHRQLWGPGVTDVAGAASHINHLLAEALGPSAGEQPPVFIDLGCGVGGTVLHLAQAFPNARLHGVTISRRQIEMAEQASRAAGVAGRVEFHRADFETLDLDLSADAIVAVESFTHSRSADSFFDVATRHLKPDGQLIVVDDFMTRREAEVSRTELRLVHAFRRGWRVPGLGTPGGSAEIAARHDLELLDERNLTSLIRLRRPRDRLIGLVAPLADGIGLTRMPLFGNLVGGNALHAGTIRGLFEYRWLRFRRAPREAAIPNRGVDSEHAGQQRRDTEE
jgi:cyclopropane fatty-acyl-phospholipid synthase-like methyltransferase